jgi:FtsP/CotA-like multicopper oxidase with cupredoxin domain
MLLPSLSAVLLSVLPLFQESVVPPVPRTVVPRALPGAAPVQINDNRTAAGVLRNGTLTVAFDVVESAWRPEGDHDPLVRLFAFAEPGKAPLVPGPLLRGPVGTMVEFTVRNRTDSTLVLHGLRPALGAAKDTVLLAPRATRTVSFRLTAEGNHFYWAGLPAFARSGDREWLDSQLTGAFIVDAPGARINPNTERIFVITEWFFNVPEKQDFETLLTFNGKAWPYNERLTFAQGDSVHFRILNSTFIEHPLHLHGFYFRVTRHGGVGADTVVAPGRQPLQNMRMIAPSGSMSLSFVPTTPGNWAFHCHIATHIDETVSLHGTPMPMAEDGGHAMPSHDAPGGHTMRGLVVGMHITPSPAYKPAVVAERREIRLLIQQKANGLIGRQTAYGFVVQKDSVVPARDSLTIPGPVLELRRGQPVRLVVQNNLTESSGVHWHGLEIESYPDGVPGFSGIGDRIMQPIPPGKSFAAEFTPPRSGTFPYHSHLHETRQIGSGMYGALIVTDGPRDLAHDHVIVAGGGGLPLIFKQGPVLLYVNGSTAPPPLVLTVGESHRFRIVSIHSEATLTFRFGTELAATRWTPLAVDGADLPPALRVTAPALVTMGPGETADFTYVPTTPGRMQLEVWIPGGQRVVQSVEVVAKRR